MKLFEALTASNTTSLYHVAKGGDYVINISGTFNSQTVTMKASPDGVVAAVNYYPDGSIATFTSADSTMIGRKFSLAPGYYSFTGSGGSLSVNIYIDLVNVR